MIVVWLFLVVPRVCLQFVIVVFTIFEGHCMGSQGLNVSSGGNLDSGQTA